MNRIDLEEMTEQIRKIAQTEARKYALACFLVSLSMLFIAAGQVELPIIIVPALLSVPVYHWRYWRHMYMAFYQQIKNVKEARMEEALALLSQRIATLEHIEKQIGLAPESDTIITGELHERSSGE